MTDVRQWDIGTVITIDLGESIETSTARRILYRKADGTSGSWTATLAPSNTGVRYTTVNGDLDVAGQWELQVYVDFAGGGKWYSTPNTLNVKPSLTRVVVV